MEFGVFTGSSINLAADFRAKNCKERSPSVFGFDTFEGLPEAWGTHRKEVPRQLATTATLVFCPPAQ